MIKLIPFHKHTVLNDIVLWRNDERIKPYLRTGLDNYFDNQDDWVDSIIKRDNCYYYFIVESTPTGPNIALSGVIIGYCGLENIHWQSKHAEISILLNPDRFRKKAGTQAVSELLTKAFSQMGLNLVYAEVYGHNPARGFWEKVGFRHEALLRDRKYWAGEYHNSIMLSIRAEEFFNK